MAEGVPVGLAASLRSEMQLNRAGSCLSPSGLCAVMATMSCAFGHST